MKISVDSFYSEGLSNYAEAISSDQLSIMAIHKTYGLVGAIVCKDMYTHAEKQQ